MGVSSSCGAEEFFYSRRTWKKIMPRTGQRQERFASAVEQAEGFYFKRAERLNGRLAMVGFAVGIATEALTGHSLINQVVFGVLGLSF